ncbi:response regulator [Legionella sp. MW5194]|uniref:response regulator transcription factor n=1 Tax=Legionella sp. MW5194 TaxID=2662448 RepID=UPI00193CA8E3|nr:response regulator [Legionella sp. MW5194]QRN04724.1 response regulator [Legionella sp. MW5194]
MMNRNVLRVYLVEDDASISKALLALFESVKIEVCSFSDPLAFLEEFDKGTIQNGCILLDIRLPNMGGLELYQKMKKHTTLPVIFITAHGDIEMAVKAMKLGAFDFISKPFNNQILLQAVQRSFSLIPLANIISQFKTNLLTLTPREKEVLEFIIKGKMNKEISYVLDIALSTVEIHRSNLMKKLKMKNLPELIHYYLMAKETAANEALLEKQPETY